MDKDEWAEKAFVYLLNNHNFMPEGTAKKQLARLLLQAPPDIKEKAVEKFIEEVNGENS
jgi:hypothetical protein